MEERRNNNGQEEVKRKRKCVRERTKLSQTWRTVQLCIHSKLTTITFNVSNVLSTSCSSNLFVTDERASLWVEVELCSWLSWIPVSNRQRSLPVISFCIQTVTMVHILLHSLNSWKFAEGPQTPYLRLLPGSSHKDLPHGLYQGSALGIHHRALYLGSSNQGLITRSESRALIYAWSNCPWEPLMSFIQGPCLA